MDQYMCDSDCVTMNWNIHVYMRILVYVVMTQVINSGLDLGLFSIIDSLIDSARSRHSYIRDQLHKEGAKEHADDADWSS